MPKDTFPQSVHFVEPSLPAVVKRAIRDSQMQVSWPRGPLLLAVALAVFLALHAVVLDGESGAEATLRLMALAGIAVAITVACIVLWNLVCAGYRIQRDRANLAEAELKALLGSAGSFDTEQLQRVVARYYDSAHTFVYFDTTSKVSLSQNVQSVRLDGDRVSIHFLQALDPASVVVRPVGGTPKLEIVELDSRHVTVRTLLPSQVIRLRIFGNIIPEIRNHLPDPEPARAAVGLFKARSTRQGAPLPGEVR